MDSNKIEIHQEDNKNENIDKNENNIDKNNIQKINENGKVIDRIGNLKESENKKTKPEIKKEKDKKSNLNDKNLIDESEIYYSNKLKEYNKSYKLFSYISIILYFIDIIISLKGDKILHSFFNIFLLIILFSSNIYQIYNFRHNFELISKELFIYVSNVIFIYIFIFVIHIVNIIYIFTSKILEIAEIMFIYENKRMKNALVIFYCFINFFIPTIHFIKLIYIKKGIKDLSLSKGEIYESDKIGDVEIIQSVINEI